MIVKFLGKRQGFSDYSGTPLPKCAEKSLNMSGFRFTHLVSVLGDDTFVSLPIVGVESCTFTIRFRY